MTLNSSDTLLNGAPGSAMDMRVFPAGMFDAYHFVFEGASFENMVLSATLDGTAGLNAHATVDMRTSPLTVTDNASVSHTVPPGIVVKLGPGSDFNVSTNPQVKIMITATPNKVSVYNVLTHPQMAPNGELMAPKNGPNNLPFTTMGWPKNLYDIDVTTSAITMTLNSSDTLLNGAPGSAMDMRVFPAGMFDAYHFVFEGPSFDNMVLSATLDGTAGLNAHATVEIMNSSVTVEDNNSISHTIPPAIVVKLGPGSDFNVSGHPRVSVTLSATAPGSAPTPTASPTAKEPSAGSDAQRAGGTAAFLAFVLGAAASVQF